MAVLQQDGTSCSVDLRGTGLVGRDYIIRFSHAFSQEQFQEAFRGQLFPELLKKR
jgi:hypothetical protein